MAKLVLVIHDVRSVLNVGSLLRTAEGFDVDEVCLTGYTPYPEVKGDARLPHTRRKLSQQIRKTALGAESWVNWSHDSNIENCLDRLKADGYLLIALEQTPDAMDLDSFKTQRPVALIVGNEVSGVDTSILKIVDKKLQIPMKGRKESFNVAVAAGIALYHLTR